MYISFWIVHVYVHFRRKNCFKDLIWENDEPWAMKESPVDNQILLWPFPHYFCPWNHWDNIIFVFVFNTETLSTALWEIMIHYNSRTKVKHPSLLWPVCGRGLFSSWICLDPRPLRSCLFHFHCVLTTSLKLALKQSNEEKESNLFFP